MKYTSLIVLLTGMLLSFGIHAQNVNEIIHKHIEAHGGTDAIGSIANMKVKGHFTAFSLREPFITFKDSSGRFYSRFQLGKHEVIEGDNGEISWTVDPWMDILFPRRMNKNEINRLKQKAELVTPFFNYEKRGFKVELAGKENVDGVDTWKILLIRPDGRRQTWFLNTGNYLAYKMESEWTDFAYPTNQFTYFDEYTTVEGVKLPFYYERTFGTRYRVTEIEKVEFNVPFDEAEFDPPKSNELQRLQPLAGSFAVRVESMNRRGQWQMVDSTKSDICFSFHNVLTGKIDYQRFFPLTRETKWTYNQDAGEYSTVIINDFDGTFNLLTGNFKDSILVMDDIKINDVEDSTGKAVYNKHEISHITKNGFVLNTYISHDRGAEWQPRERFTYIRKSEKEY